MDSTQAVIKSRHSLAYNTTGIPYDHQVDKTYEGCMLRVRNISGHFLDLAVEQHSTRTSLTPHPEELVSDGTTCIWIGMLPKAAQSHTFAMLKNQAGVPKKGQSIRDADTPLIIQHDPYAIRVVVVLSHTMNKYYALVDGKQGLYEGRRVNLEHIFFFTTFRDDDIGAREKRGEIWSTKIRDFKAQIAGAKQGPQQKKQDPIRKAAQVKRNFTNQLQGLLANYLRDPQEMYLDAMQEAIKQEDQDIQHQPVGCEAIMAVVEGKSEATIELAEAAIKEMTTLWADLVELKITAQEMMELSRGLLWGGITLDYALIRPYIVDWVRHRRVCSNDDDTLGQLAAETLHFTRMGYGGASSVPLPVQDNDFIAFVDTTIENLRALETYGYEYIDAVTGSLGEDYTGRGLPEIFEGYAATPDIEGAQQWIKNSSASSASSITIGFHDAN